MTLCVRFFLSLLFVAFITKYASAGDVCSISTLKGTYQFAASGYNGGKFFAYAGMLLANGNGSIKLRKTDATKPVNSCWIDGSYSVYSDCRVQVNYVGGRSALYYLAPDGKNLSFVLTNGLAVSGVAYLVSVGQILPSEGSCN